MREPGISPGMALTAHPQRDRRDDHGTEPEAQPIESERAHRVRADPLGDESAAPKKGGSQ